MATSQTSIAKNFYVVSSWKTESQKNCGDPLMCCVSVMLVVKFYQEWESFMEKFSIKVIFQTHQDGGFWNYQKPTSHF